MRVLVDFTQIPTDRTGVGVYAENLVRELSHEFEHGDELILLIQKDEQKMRELARHSPNVLLVPLSTGLLRHRALLLLYEQVVLPFVLFWKKIDVVHSLHYTHPLVSPCPRVVTIHDVTFLLFPELHTRGRRLVMPFFIKRAVRRVEALIFVSKATADDSCKLIPGIKTNLSKIIPLGVDLQGFAVSAEAANEVLEKLSILEPFVLFLGTIEPRKNVLRLVRAFERIAPQYPDLLLVLAGKPGWDCEEVFGAIELSAHKNRIRHLGFISESEKKALLVKCEALVYPSLYEGFGLPVLEAMAAGAPVITSNISSLPEVVGNAAILTNPVSVEELADAMKSLIGNDATRDDLRARGKLRASEFSWPSVATLTYDLYKQVAKK
jgi:glycosyltransferase involved in cell wall biosynthesis